MIIPKETSKRLWPVLLFLALCRGVSAAPESDWFARVWQSEEGLPNNNVMSVSQTSDGFLWLGTGAGLVRFDGVRFDLIASTNFIVPPNRGVVRLAPARNGGLWLAMDRGAVVLLNRGNPQVWTGEHGLPDSLAHGMAEGGDGTLWIHYIGGSLVSLKDAGASAWTSQNGGPPPGPMCSLARDRDGVIWVARGGEVGVMREGVFHVLARTGVTNTRIAPARTGGTWIAAGLRLIRCDEQGGLTDLGEFTSVRPGVNPTALLEDQHGAVWLGTSYGGVYRYDGTRFERVPTSHSEVLSLAEDMEGNIWVGTHGGGLNRLRQRTVRLETMETGLPLESVQSACEDAAGTLWVVTGNGVIARRVEDRWTTFASSEWPGGSASCIVAGHEGDVWIGTRQRRLIRWNKNKFESWPRTRGLEATTILALLIDRSGAVWIGGQNQTVQRFQDGAFQHFDVPEDTRVIRAVAEDAAGTVWFGSSKGVLLRVEDNRLVDKSHLIGDEFRPIRTLHGTSDGSLWIGFAGWGVGRLKGGKFSLMGTDVGLHDRYISQIMSDGRGWLWFGGDLGLFKVRQEELDAVAEGRASRVQSFHYGRGEGLPSLYADMGYMPNATRGKDGRLWFPTRSGLAMVDPVTQADREAAPPVLLTRMAVDEQTAAEYAGVLPDPHPVDLGELSRPLHLPPGHRKLQFDFTALSFTAPESVRFQYQLHGFDGGWVDGGVDRHATYSRLPAGRYEFRVRASNRSGLWNEEAATLAFVVDPFIWQTWWFRVGTVVLFCSLTLLVVRYVFLRRLHLRLRALEQEAALHKERSRIARDLHDDLGSRLTKLVLLSDLLQDHREGEGSDSGAQQVASAARQVIKALDETVWAVNPRNDTLAHLIDYVGQFSVEFLRAAGVRCHVDLPVRVEKQTVSADIRHNLFLVVKEALNNVVRHAGATEVWLRIEAGDRMLALSIEDNGRGFVPGGDQSEADGLRNMRQRCEEIGGTFDIESRPGGGTRIRVNLRWNSRHFGGETPELH